MCSGRHDLARAVLVYELRPERYAFLGLGVHAWRAGPSCWHLPLKHRSCLYRARKFLLLFCPPVGSDSRSEIHSGTDALEIISREHLDAASSGSSICGVLRLTLAMLAFAQDDNLKTKHKVLRAQARAQDDKQKQMRCPSFRSLRERVRAKALTYPRALLRSG